MIDLCAGLPVANCAGWLFAKYDPPVFCVFVVVVAGHAHALALLGCASARCRACSQFVNAGHVVNFMFVVCFVYVNLFAV